MKQMILMLLFWNHCSTCVHKEQKFKLYIYSTWIHNEINHRFNGNIKYFNFFYYVFFIWKRTSNIVYFEVKYIKSFINLMFITKNEETMNILYQKVINKCKGSNNGVSMLVNHCSTCFHKEQKIKFMHLFHMNS